MQLLLDVKKIMNPYCETSLESDFQIQCNRLYNGHPVDWTFVRLHMGSMTTIHNKGLFWKMYRFIMNCFKALKVKDSCVVSAVLQLAYFMCMHDCVLRLSSDFMKESGTEELLKCMRLNIPSCGNYRCNSVYKLMTVPRTEIRNLENYNSESCISGRLIGSWQLLPIMCTFSKKYTNLIADLVKYGVIDQSPSYEDGAYLSVDVMFSFRGMYFEDVNDECIISYPAVASEEAWKRYLYICRTLRMFIDIKGTSRCRVKRRWSDRDYSGSRSELIRCFRMILNCTPEPFPSGGEIRKYLVAVFPQYAKKETFKNRRSTFDKVIDRIIKEFSEILPQSAEPLAPRSLGHLSRCQIRDNMRIAGSLPHGVEELELPHSLKQYILLQEDY